MGGKKEVLTRPWETTWARPWGYGDERVRVQWVGGSSGWVDE